MTSHIQCTSDKCTEASAQSRPEVRHWNRVSMDFESEPQHLNMLASRIASMTGSRERCSTTACVKTIEKMYMMSVSKTIVQSKNRSVWKIENTSSRRARTKYMTRATRRALRMRV